MHKPVTLTVERVEESDIANVLDTWTDDEVKLFYDGDDDEGPYIAADDPDRAVLMSEQYHNVNMKELLAYCQQRFGEDFDT